MIVSPALEAPAVIAGLDDIAVVGQAIDLELEVVEVLGERQLGDGELVLDRGRLFLVDLGVEQITDDALGFMLAFDGKAQVAKTARLKVPMRRLEADCFVVAKKRRNARGAKGQAIDIGSGQPGSGQTDSGRNSMFNGRREPSHGGTSRMMREYQVRICERLGVKFLGPTRQLRLPSALVTDSRRR